MRPQPRLQKNSHLPLLLCAAGVLTLLAFPFLWGGGDGSSSAGGPIRPVIDFGTGQEEPVYPIGPDHWMDAELARNILNQWLTTDPHAPTITVARKDLIWVQALTASAARQQAAAHPRHAFKPLPPVTVTDAP